MEGVEVRGHGRRQREEIEGGTDAILFQIKSIFKTRKLKAFRSKFCLKTFLYFKPRNPMTLAQTGFLKFKTNGFKP